MIGISTGNGYPLPFESRYALYKAAGFDSIILWWGNDDMATRADRVWLTKVYDLKIEHAHASTDALNLIWLEGNAGNRTTNRLLHEIADCAEFGIRTLVIHLTNGSTPPPITSIGLHRIEHLIRLVEEAHVRLAFENLRIPQHTQYVLELYPSPFVGLCYDSGHEHFWTPFIDWLQTYGDRISGQQNSHHRHSFSQSLSRVPPLFVPPGSLEALHAPPELPHHAKQAVLEHPRRFFPRESAPWGG